MPASYGVGRLTGGDSELAMLWSLTPDGWRIGRADPPLLRMEQIALFRYRYQGW